MISSGHRITGGVEYQNLISISNFTKRPEVSASTNPAMFATQDSLLAFNFYKKLGSRY
jgi:hypothetical protein